MASAVLWLVTAGLFLFGLLGVFVPFLPGIALIFAGIVFYAVATGFTVISGPTLAIFGAIALLAWLLECAGALIGARAGGGSSLALVGLIIGGFIGLLAGGPPGLLIGVFVGALLGALAHGRTMAESNKIALYSLVGIVGAKVVQAFISVAIIVAFGLLVLL